MPRLGFRWTICALLFFATTINYIDRQVLGILAPDLQRLIGWNELQYGYIVSAFQAAYAIGFMFAGRLMDRLGTRRGYAIAPGVFRTSLNQALLDTTPRGRELLMRTPMGRFGCVEELAGAAVFLASDAASFVTGQVVIADGGLVPH